MAPANVIDLTASSPLDATADATGRLVLVDNDQPVFIPDNHDPPSVSPLTDEQCFRRVLEIFPDISHDHVRGLLHGHDKPDGDGAVDNLPPHSYLRIDRVLEHLLSANSYPKQESNRTLKRKRECPVDPEAEFHKWEQQAVGVVPEPVKQLISDLLKTEFPEIPRNHIIETQSRQKSLFRSYVALAHDHDETHAGRRAYRHGRASKLLPHDDPDAEARARGWDHGSLAEELEVARRRVTGQRAQRIADDVRRQEEEANLQRAKDAGETAECSACFDDRPMNRQIHCDGPTTHFTCFDCAHTYISSEVGEARCNVVCPSGCGAGFAHSQLHLLPDTPLLDKLAQIRQEKDIRDAGLDDLAECPFCDYKVCLPPVETDFEFRCYNPDCEQVSCRRCKAVSHTPLSCEQHARDNPVNTRHTIEEAMTAALVRACNSCKKTFIKLDGCNKMRCPSCGHMQCYVCSSSITDYSHFQSHAGINGQPAPADAPARCPLSDDVEERHEREVQNAQAAATAAVVRDRPDLRPEDLEIPVSDAVKQDAAERRRRRNMYGGIALPRRRHGDPPGIRLPAGMMDDMDPYPHLPVGGQAEFQYQLLELEEMNRVRLARQHPFPNPVWVPRGAPEIGPRPPFAPILPIVPLAMPVPPLPHPPAADPRARYPYNPRPNRARRIAEAARRMEGRTRRMEDEVARAAVAEGARDGEIETARPRGVAAEAARATGAPPTQQTPLVPEDQLMILRRAMLEHGGGFARPGWDVGDVAGDAAAAAAVVGPELPAFEGARGVGGGGRGREEGVNGFDAAVGGAQLHMYVTAARPDGRPRYWMDMGH